MLMIIFVVLGFFHYSEGKMKQKPASVMVLFEYISTGNQPETNWRWKIMDDGSYYQSSNKPSKDFKGNEFNVPFPAKPNFTLDKEEIERLEKTIRDEGFFALKDLYKSEIKIYDGSILRVTVNLDGKSHTVTIENPDVNMIEEVKRIDGLVNEFFMKREKKKPKPCTYFSRRWCM